MRVKCAAAILACSVGFGICEASAHGAELSGTWARSGTSWMCPPEFPPCDWEDTAEFWQLQGFYIEVALAGGVTFVGITVGVEPNKELASQIGIEVNKGILVDDQLKTSEANIFAIGDCAEVRNPASGRKSVEAVWYTGRIMGETVAQTITGKSTDYNPGTWFNSAKFFDLEYQTYGFVPNNELDDHYYKFKAEFCK